MANTIAVVGGSGTGKSTSIRNLDPKETAIINCAGKPLPFKGSAAMYNIANKNFLTTSTSAEVLGALKEIAKNPQFKNVIVDDSLFIMTDMFFNRSAEKGYDKFTDIAKAYQSMLQYCKTMRDDLNIAIMMHVEDEVSNGIKVQQKVKTVGKLVDEKYDPLSVVSVALFTDVSFDKEGKAQYQFVTNRQMVQGVVIPAKSPDGMFEEIRIPNDLKEVFRISREYYNLNA